MADTDTLKVVKTYKAKVVKCSNYFKVINPDQDIKKLCYTFTKQFVKFNYLSVNKLGETIQTVFASATKSRTEFRFHINTWETWQELLKRNFINDSLIETIIEPEFDVYTFKCSLRESFKLRDYQQQQYEYLIDPNVPCNRFIGMRPGSGKGVTAIAALMHYGMRTIIIVRPGYVKKWQAELIEKADITKDDVLILQSTKDLQDMLLLAKHQQLGAIKFIVMGNTIYRTWIKAYEEFGSDSQALGYGVNPDELFKVTQSGIRVIDEVHQDFHLNFKADLYTHTRECISLSATLISKDWMLSRMQEVAYPLKWRAPEVQFDKYVDICAVHYWLNNRKVSTSLKAGVYSHIAYEKSIIKQKELYKNYSAMIMELIETGYIARRKTGQKCIVYAASIKMCDKLVDDIRKRFKGDKVTRFCEMDDVSKLHSGDIVVTNVIKAGTAHDVAGLITVIMTNAIDSVQSNIQIFGRLRQIEGSDTKFYYLTCQNLPKHKVYHRNKMELLRPRARSFKEYWYPTRL